MPTEITSREFGVLNSETGMISAFLTALYVNYEKDVAIYEAPEGVLQHSFPRLSIGNSSQLKEGNFVYIIGNPRSAGINIRGGTVNALQWQGVGLPHSEADKRHFFMLDAGIIQGDSGAPILAIMDGEYELVGIASATDKEFERLGFAIKINVVRDVVQSCIVCPPELKCLFAVPKTKKVPHL